MNTSFAFELYAADTGTRLLTGLLNPSMYYLHGGQNFVFVAAGFVLPYSLFIAGQLFRKRRGNRCLPSALRSFNIKDVMLSYFDRVADVQAETDL